jgi:hypothetical protein
MSAPPMTEEPKARPPRSAFKGIYILEVSTSAAAAYATMHMADHGACVLKLIPNAGDPLVGHPAYQLLNRGKDAACVSDAERQAFLQNVGTRGCARAGGTRGLAACVCTCARARTHACLGACARTRASFPHSTPSFFLFRVESPASFVRQLHISRGCLLWCRRLLEVSHAHSSNAPRLHTLISASMRLGRC